jgi:plastocyanin
MSVSVVPERTVALGAGRVARTVLGLLSLLTVALAVGRPAPAFAVELELQVELVRPNGRGLVRDALPSEVVVAWQPAASARVQAGTFVIATKNKAFEPGSLVVARGSTVRFPNEDPVLHNVFSVSPGNAFDVGLYSKGEGKSTRLETPGLVRIFCNVHQQMVAYVLVADTPYATRPDNNGVVRLTGLPAGAGKLLVWHERSSLREIPLDSPQAAPAVLEVEVERRQVPPHFNKLGLPYERRARDRYGG